jgi:WD40 repeat protein
MVTKIPRFEVSTFGAAHNTSSNMSSSSSTYQPISAAWDSINLQLDQLVVASPPTDAISALTFSPVPNSTRFVVSSWDKNVYLYDLRDENGDVGEGKLLQVFPHSAPVLDVCFGVNDDEIFSTGLDWDVRK